MLSPSPDPDVKPIEPEMVHIPAGSFRMGTSDQQIEWLARHTDWARQWREKGRFDREQPQQSVTLPGYAIARYPTTDATSQKMPLSGRREAARGTALISAPGQPLAV